MTDANSILLNGGAAEVRRLADSATAFARNGIGASKSGTPTPVRFTRFSDIHLGAAARYLVKGLIPNTGLVVVWGPPKCGKSFWVFDLVAHIAAGWQYRGRRVKQCPVVYFAFEGQEGFRARVEAFRQRNTIADMPFYLSADRVTLPADGPAVVAAIRTEFTDVKPGVVVLDTLNRSIAGSENDPSDMGAYVKAADAIREAFDCVVVVIHHCGVEGARPRGHTSLTGAADAQIAVKRDESDRVIAMVEFMKDGPQGDSIVSELEQMTVGADEDGEEITSCVVRPCDGSAASRQTRATGQPAIALDILRELIVDIGTVPPSSAKIPVGTRTTTEETWRAGCYAKMFTEDRSQTAKQKAFVRAAKRLQDLQLIGKWGDHVWLA